MFSKTNTRNSCIVETTVLLDNITSSACLFRSRLNDICSRYFHLEIFWKDLFNLYAEILTSRTMEYAYVSSANNLTVDTVSFVRQLMKVAKKKENLM